MVHMSVICRKTSRRRYRETSNPAHFSTSAEMSETLRHQIVGLRATPEVSWSKLFQFSVAPLSESRLLLALYNPSSVFNYKYEIIQREQTTWPFLLFFIANKKRFCQHGNISLQGRPFMPYHIVRSGSLPPWGRKHDICWSCVSNSILWDELVSLGLELYKPLLWAAFVSLK